jgi:hypothetical protein
LPTAFPRPRRVEPKRSLFGVVLNAFMVMSALILTVIVLVREERYAMGEPGIFADAIVQMMQQNAPARSGDRAIIPPSN